MVPLFNIFGFLFLVMETFIGMVANGSIVLINFINWFQRGKLSPVDLILICVGLSRLLLQAVVILGFTLVIFLNITMSNSKMFTLKVIWLFTNAMNLWIAACLSVFYLAKIAIFSHPLFLQLKQQFSGMVPWLLLGSVVASAVKTIVVTTSWNYGLFACYYYRSLLSNRSNTEMNWPPVCRNTTVLSSVLDLIPFMVFLSTSTLLIGSLWKHMRHVQGNGTGNRDVNTQAHLSAIKALASFAVLYVVSFAVLTFESVLVSKKKHTWTTVLYAVSALYPSGHAIILILINPKLKQAWVKMIHRLKCHLSKVQS